MLLCKQRNYSLSESLMGHIGPQSSTRLKWRELEMVLVLARMCVYVFVVCVYTCVWGGGVGEETAILLPRSSTIWWIKGCFLGCLFSQGFLWASLAGAAWNKRLCRGVCVRQLLPQQESAGVWQAVLDDMDDVKCIHIVKDSIWTFSFHSSDHGKQTDLIAGEIILPLLNNFTNS